MLLTLLLLSCVKYSASHIPEPGRKQTLFILTVTSQQFRSSLVIPKKIKTIVF